MELYIYHKIRNFGPWEKIHENHTKLKKKQTLKKSSREDGRSKIRNFSDVSVGEHRLHLASAFVER